MRRTGAASRNVNLARCTLGMSRFAGLPMVVIKDKFIPARAGERCRKLDAKVAEQAEQIATPSGSHGGGAKSVFQHQVPADDPGKNLTQRSIAIGVSRTGNGDGGGKFRIAQSGKDAPVAARMKERIDGRAGKFRRGCSGKNKDSCADNRANAECNQIVYAESPLQAVFAGFIGFVQNKFQRFGGKQSWPCCGTSLLIDAIDAEKTCHSKIKPSAAAEGRDISEVSC